MQYWQGGFVKTRTTRAPLVIIDLPCARRYCLLMGSGRLLLVVFIGIFRGKIGQCCQYGKSYQ